MYFYSVFFFFFRYRVSCVFFFFFQAEDGIRDGHVTGVQTCALPISLWRPRGKTDEDATVVYLCTSNRLLSQGQPKACTIPRSRALFNTSGTPPSSPFITTSTVREARDIARYSSERNLRCL